MKRLALLAAALIMGTALPACSQVARKSVKVVKEYPHDTGSYTQGLFWDSDRLLETTGQYGSSTLRVVDLETGKASFSKSFNRKYFVEGSVILDGKLFILTWKNNVAFIYDAATLEYLQSYTYPREGWGLTTDGKSLIASDGSSNIYFMTPDFKPVKTLKVTLNGRPVRYLNELEWIDGKIWANVYTTDSIVVIDPETGKITEVIDCSGLLPDALRTRDTDVLNGIACKDGKIYLTGKNWPRLYEVKVK